ncbi:MAG TPA: hypothetical protein G4O11_10720 [Anaerolineae bacterium]|nr:hypothetical protein [Anaerolineae bacterium]
MHQPRSTSTTLGLGLISAGTLAFEIGLTRLFAVQQFHHFAFMVISLAVMGIAASGVLLALRPKHPPLSVLAFAYALSIVLAYLTINLLPFDSYSIAWDRRQIGILIFYFFVAGLPFLLAGWTIGACLTAAGREAHLPYAANLVGSALGCPAALAALTFFGGEGAVALAISLGLLAAFVLTPRTPFRAILVVLFAITIWGGIDPPKTLTLRLSPYKPLSVTSLAPDAQTTVTRWSASTRIDVVESNSIHVLPGLSLNAKIEPPLQAALFVDGDGPLPINNLSPNESKAKNLSAYMPAALAFQLRPNAQALLLQPGAGLDTIIALAAGASHVTLAIDEPLIQEILTGPYADFSYHLLDDPRLTVISRPSRSVLHIVQPDYDVIQFALSQSYRPVASGAFSITEDFSLTVEAIGEAYDQLTEKGLLVITRWLGTPPSESARTWATLLAALRAHGINDPASYLVAYRGMRTATMIAAKQPFSPTELNSIRTFLQENAFDPIHLPDLEPSELNRYNQLPRDTYHELFSSLLKDPSATIDSYSFNLKPPTDDRPFFYHFFRWRQIPDIMATLGLVWQPFGGSGYLVLLALLGLMILLSILLILSPLIILGRGGSWSPPGWGTIGYFACLGAGYLLIEIPLIQKLTLLLDRPALALATVLFTLLLTSGIGSLLSTRLNLRTSLAILVILLGLTIIALPWIIELALPWSLVARLLMAVAVLSPCGLLMGVPFATGLRRLEERSPGSIPWAWAINGSISGVSGVLAALISLDAGFTVTLVVGTLAYLGAWSTAPKLTQGG